MGSKHSNPDRSPVRRPGLLGGFMIPIPILTDSYKPTHFRQFPEATKMVAYGECRTPFENDQEDQRLVFFGIRYIIDNYISQKWTMQDVELAERFFSTHNAGKTEFPFPKELFIKFIKENNGYFPVKIQALPEGTIMYPHVPVYQITATGEYSRLVTYLETLLTMVWYPTTVATLSRRAYTIIANAFDKSVDDSARFLLDSRLHDFGFRGCTSVEQSIIGGSAHLLNFDGSDTMSAAFYAQFHLNQGRPIAESIPATEHSVMTSHLNEKSAIENMIQNYGGGIFACVMDSYDYAHALNEILPAIASQKIEKGGFIVLRPDSGNSVEVVLMALRAADKVFGSDLNSKGFKVLRGCSVIQGDGITLNTIPEILNAALAEGFSAQNIAFGMGAGLLQKMNRDTTSFATKLCHIVYKNGTSRNIMKTPKTDSTKVSLPGELAVKLNQDGLPVVYPASHVPDENNLFQVVYDHGPVFDIDSTDFSSMETKKEPQPKKIKQLKAWPSFDDIREKIKTTFPKYPLRFDVISPELQQLIEKTMDENYQNIPDLGRKN